MCRDNRGRMEQKNTFDLTGLSADVSSKVEPFVKDLVSGLGEKVESFAVTGSCLTGDYLPGVSDINSALILREIEMPELDFIARIMPRHRKKLVRPPLIITDEHIRRSLDVFPIEFLDLKLFHRTVYGADKLTKLPIEKLNLRLQCERDLKGKLINLQRGFILCEGRNRDLKLLLLDVFTGFFPLLRAMLFMVQLNTELPMSKASVLEEVESIFDISMAGLKEILLMKAQKKIFHKEPDIHRLFGEVCRITHELSQKMDRMAV